MLIHSKTHLTLLFFGLNGVKLCNFGRITKQFGLMDWCCPSVCLSVCLSTFWLIFKNQFWNLLCNPAIPSWAVTCIQDKHENAVSWNPGIVKGWLGGFRYLAPPLNPRMGWMNPESCYPKRDKNVADLKEKEWCGNTIFCDLTDMTFKWPS